MPESPLFLMVEGKAEEAKEALRWLRNGYDSEIEFERLQYRAQDVLENRKQKISLKIITQRCTWRALLICMGLIINQQFSGPAPITSYTLTIFQDSGTTIPASIATILIGTLQTTGSLLSTLTIEKSGRRMLLISSDIIMAICLFTLAAYLYFRGLGWDLGSLGWLPVACLSVYILGMGAAVGPLPFTIVTELVSPRARNMVQSICMTLGSLTTFTAIISFMPLIGLVGQHGCFCLYALVCVAGAVCVFFMMPETKNRSIEDVIRQLNGDDYIRSVLRRDSSEDHPITSQEHLKIFNCTVQNDDCNL
ncbi:facilitated trehalose transporter Tret1-like [Bacillus rossius redtenbacheri]|uniref:facilitated trehalose transporter Tret1-like n=1 Tax=Bacillus rossius redtenbacheri TaxID=93214 RepID=UPI002FDE05B0